MGHPVCPFRQCDKHFRQIMASMPSRQARFNCQSALEHSLGRSSTHCRTGFTRNLRCAALRGRTNQHPKLSSTLGISCLLAPLHVWMVPVASYTLALANHWCISRGNRHLLDIPWGYQLRSQFPKCYLRKYMLTIHDNLPMRKRDTQHRHSQLPRWEGTVRRILASGFMPTIPEPRIWPCS